MMIRFKFLPAAGSVLAATLAIAALLCPARPAGAEELRFATAKGPAVFDVEIADTPEQHALGLMFRKDLAANGGMIFIYHPPAPVTMWMKNTYIPLDMVFIDADHKVVRIAADTVPLSETHIPSGGMVEYVVELAGGTAARIGLRPGDKVDGLALH